MKSGDWVKVNKPRGSIHGAIGKVLTMEREDGETLYRVHLYKQKLICWFDSSEINKVGKDK